MANTSYVEAETHIHITANGLRQSEQDTNLILFSKPLVITDDTVQKNGTRYDIPSLDLSAFRGKLWANHEVDRFENALAKVIGLRKEDNKVTIDSLKFFSNGYAQLAKDMMLDGAADEFSIGTRGQEYDEFGVYHNHSMHEVSLVGIANNYNAHLNGVEQLVEMAVQNGFDLKKYKLESNMTKVQAENSEEAVKDEEVVASEDQVVEQPVEDVKATETEEVKEDDEVEAGEGAAVPEAGQATENSIDYDKLAEAINKANAEKPAAKADFKNTIEEKQTIMKTTQEVSNKFEGMSAAQRLIEAAKLERNGLYRSEEYKELNELAKSEYKNALGDDELGGLIAPAELLPDVTKCSPRYAEFLNTFRYRPGKLHYSLNNLYSNVRFVVAGCGVPATQSGADINNLIVTQETLRTYTPICNKNIEFSAVDVESLFENEYQVAFDRALVEYAIGQFEVAVETRLAGYTLSTGTAIAADSTAHITYSAGDAKAIADFVNAVKDCSDGAVLVMNRSSVTKMVTDFTEGGVLNTSGGIAVNSKQLLESIFDAQIVVVPNTVLPTVGSGDTRTIEREGAADITVNHAIFAVAPDNFLGLYAPMTFDVSSEASYEVTEGEGEEAVTVQRSPKLYDETVLWGRMHRGGGVKDLRWVAGVSA